MGNKGYNKCFLVDCADLETPMGNTQVSPGKEMAVVIEGKLTYEGAVLER